MSGTTSERSNTGVREGGRSSGAGNGSMTIDIRPMIEDVSQVMTKHITNILSGVIGEYTVYKETHDTIMGLPCVRKLQERIYELEQHNSGEGHHQEQKQHQQTQHMKSREDEISQLQSAIVDLNRYIHALESRVDMKNVSGGTSSITTAASAGGHDEESVRLEVHENDNQSGDGSGEEDEEGLEEEECLHKNVIITSDALETVVEAGDEEDAEEDENLEVDEAAEEEEEKAEDEKEEDAEEDPEKVDADAEADEAPEEEADAEADEAPEEEADAEADEAPEEEEVEEPEEETEEVEEVIIKGKTYFTTNPQNGIIYACVDDDVGDEVGVFKNGVAVFNKGKK